MIRLIRHPRFQWSEPRRAVALRKQALRQAVPFGRRALAVLIPSAGTGLVAAALASAQGGVAYGLAFGGVSGLCMLGLVHLASNPRARIYVLDDCIAVHWSRYEYVDFEQLESVDTVAADLNGEPVTLLDLRVLGGERLLVGVDRNVPEVDLLDFIRAKIPARAS